VFEDPASAAGTDEEQLAVFRRVRDQIESRVITWLQDAE
jgi:arsenate reductase